MSYISIQDFKRLFQFKDELKIENIINAISNEKLVTDILIKNGEEINTLSFLKSLDKQKLLFWQWIENHTELSALLQTKMPQQSFFDGFKWSKHPYFKKFKAFVSEQMYLSLLLLWKSATISEKAKLSTFWPLLEEKKLLELELTIMNDFKSWLNEQLNGIDSLENENDFVEQLAYSCNNDSITLINHFSRKNYRLKLWFLERIIACFEYKACTKRSALWLLNHLGELDLNPMHKKLIERLKIEKNHDFIQVEAPVPSKIHQTFKLNRYAITILSLGLFMLIFYWFFKDAILTKNIIQQQNDHTSFEQFNPTERQELDSLIGILEGKNLNKNQKLLSLSSNELNITLRTAWKNREMKLLYNDFCIDAERDKNTLHNCEELSSKELNKINFEDSKKLKDFKGKNAIQLKNDSEYDMLIFLFKDNKNDVIYSTLLLQNQSINLKLIANSKMLFIPGRKMSKYCPEKGSKVLPRKTFKYHFCQINNNYLDALNEIYTVNKTPRNAQIIFSGKWHTHFEITDSKGVLRLD